jgi:hypothetical protein
MLFPVPLLPKLTDLYINEKQQTATNKAKVIQVNPLNQHQQTARMLHPTLHSKIIYDYAIYNK